MLKENSMKEEDLDNKPDIHWDAEPTRPKEPEKDSYYPGPKDAPRPHIPEGEYEAVCIEKNIAPYKNHGDKLYLKYEILSGEHKGTILFRAINFEYDSFSLNTDYYTEWSLANGAPPKRIDRMTPRVFLNKSFLIKVRNAKPKYDDGTEKDEMFQYSVVDRIIKLIK